jgi:hypothetical protein
MSQRGSAVARDDVKGIVSKNILSHLAASGSLVVLAVRLFAMI